MNILDVLSDIEYSTLQDISNIEINLITSDIDKIHRATAYVMVESHRFENEGLVEYVISKTPDVIVCNETQDLPACSIPIIRVKSARRALSFMLSKFCGVDYSLTNFFAITGTNGKTSTATLLHKIIEANGEKVGFIGTGKIIIDGENIVEPFYSMTTPDPELLYPVIKRMQEYGCTSIVMEVSSHSIALEKISPIPFLFSIFTNLSEEHLDFHKNMENYYYTKLRLFHQSKNGIFNEDDKYSARARAELFDVCNTYSVGVLWNGDAVARDVVLKGFSGSCFIYKEKKFSFKANLRLPGSYNIYNAMLALKCAIAYGIKPCVAKRAVENCFSVDGRFEKIEDDIVVIIDYAHTSEAMENILKTVNSFKNQGQNILCVFGCGGNRDKQKRAKMAMIAEKLSDVVIVTEDNSRSEPTDEIIADIFSGFKDCKKHHLILPRSHAIEFAIENARKNDVVLILGKGHERYSIDNDGYHYFDEREIVLAALKRRKAK